MFLLQATNIKKSYGERVILDFESFQIYEGDKIGVIGSNGAGKSTLMGLLYGEIAPDSGSVARRCNAGFIRQLPPSEEGRSGGETAKLQIQRQTGREDALLFADEPTANLDAQGVKWAKAKLTASKTVVLVSHDRELLDAVCNRIVEVRDSKLYFFTGTYSDYQKALEAEAARLQMEYDRYRRKKAQLESAVQARDQQVSRQRQKKRREYAANSSEARLGGHKRAASMKKQERIASVLSGRLDRLESVEKTRELPKLSIDFALSHPPEGKLVLQGENLHFAYGDNVVFSGASFCIENRTKTALTGKNGAGKTTLLQMIRDGACGISKAPKLKAGFLYQDFQDLDCDRTVLDNVLSSSIQDPGSVRGVLAGLLFRGDDVFKKVFMLSGGEKMRLSIAKLITGDVNALLLDEPTNYLDIHSLAAVERVLQEYPGTLLLVSHDQRFSAAVTSQTLRIEGGKIRSGQTELWRAPDCAQRMVLDLRRIQLLEKLASAPPGRKEALEKEYAQVVSMLRE